MPLLLVVGSESVCLAYRSASTACVGSESVCLAYRSASTACVGSESVYLDFDILSGCVMKKHILKTEHTRLTCYRSTYGRVQAFPQDRIFN